MKALITSYYVSSKLYFTIITISILKDFLAKVVA